MVDSHTHLSFCEPPDADLVEAAVGAGVEKLVTVGTTGITCREALQAAKYAPDAPVPRIQATTGFRAATCFTAT